MSAAIKAENYINTFRLLKPIAEDGDTEAQCLVANIYHLGLGLEKDVLEAVKWYKKSAQQGYSVASNNLAGIFMSGDLGINLDQAEVTEWYQKAREQGFFHAPY